MLGRCGRVQLRTVVNRGIFMEIVLWLAFLVIVIGLLALDLGVLNRKAHVISTPEALGWTAIWVILALVFNVAVYYLYEHHLLGIGAELGHELNGRQAALLFFTGYLVEKSLSLDNIFVIALIFAYFRVPAMYQHRVLFWGILGALVLRGAMILAGAALIRRFDWIIYVFGALLILTAVKMLVARHDNLEPNKNPLVKLARRLYPVSPDFEGSRFFTRLEGRRAVTPLFLVLLVVESSDVLFAVDSIPAIFAVTTDPFIVFTSNVFAILGLRSLYFVLAGIMDKFRYLKMSLVFLLAYIGVKMLLSHHYPIPTFVSLCVICGILAVGILASIYAGQRDTARLSGPMPEPLPQIVETAAKQMRRVVILLVGCSVILVGLVMIVLPGPAFLVIPAGLAILATEFVWARRLLRKLKRNAVAVKNGLLGRS